MPDSKKASEEVDIPLSLAKRAFEKQKIISVLKISRTITEAAKLLNIARTTLASRLASLGIDPDTHLIT